MKRMTITEAQEQIIAINAVKEDLTKALDKVDELYRSMSHYEEISDYLNNDHDQAIIECYKDMCFTLTQELTTFARLFKDTTKRSYELMRLREDN